MFQVIKMNIKIFAMILLTAVAGLAGCTDINNQVSNHLDNDKNSVSGNSNIKKFNSPEEIQAFLKEKSEEGGYWGGGMSAFADGMAIAESAMPMTKSMDMAVDSVAPSSAPSAGQGADDFSTTNIQVEGVDEADIVKNDGRYIYMLSGSTVSIVDAYPPEGAAIIASIEVDGNPQELYINGDRLVILGNEYIERPYPVQYEGKMAMPEMDVMPYGGPSSIVSLAHVFDVSDHGKPELVRKVSVDGNYFDSRMIGDYVYFIATQYTYYHDDVIRIPEIMTEEGNKTPDVYYFDAPDNSYSFTSIVSLNVKEDVEEVDGKIYLLGSTQNMFVSRDNVYVTYQKRMPYRYYYERIINEAVKPLVPGDVAVKLEEIYKKNKTSRQKDDEANKVLEKYTDGITVRENRELVEKIDRNRQSIEAEIQKEMEKTVVHKIAISKGEIEYKASGEAPGNVLNQFSMDEFNGYFRIATTTGNVWDQSSSNHIYVMDKNLKVVGSVEDLAPGERIYSARFMGDRAYMVTFKKVDPLFVIDLSEPENPEVLGKLKIPGYSDYLHPYDEDHIIGIGKEVVEADEGDFAYYQGVKLALFDVSDVTKPKELAKYEIGDRGTDSYALQDHKAFLFSRDRNLLVIPVLLAEINEEQYPTGLPKHAYGEYTWQGAYVFSIDTENGIELKGGITHEENDEKFLKSGYYYPGSKYSVKRSLYMDDTLYTISDGRIKMNDLDTLDEINKVNLPGMEDNDKPRYEMMR